MEISERIDVAGRWAYFVAPRSGGWIAECRAPGGESEEFFQSKSAAVAACHEWAGLEDGTEVDVRDCDSLEQCQAAVRELEFFPSVGADGLAEVCGSYAGAIPWRAHPLPGETADEMATRLAESAGCDWYYVAALA